MSRPRRPTFSCRSCSAPSARWVGQCPSCQAWNALAEAPPDEPTVATPRRAAVAPARPMADVQVGEARPVPTGVAEFDRVLAGGLVPGSVTLLGGEPGIGKSTLVLQAVSSALAGGGRALYLAAEEAASQVRARADRLGVGLEGLWVVDEPVVDDVADHLGATGAGLVVVDSIQAVRLAERAGPPGAVAQVRDSAQHLADEARRRGVAVVLVGHVTKDGSLAGPRQLEHLVDTVLTFEGDRHHGLRQLRASKHRFGPTHELGLFEMTERGLVGVPDASGLFLADRLVGVPGSIVHPMVEGRRPLLVELQALVAPAPGPPPSPRRSAEGVDGGRLAVLLAVLERRVGVPLGRCDVHALAVGGVRVVEPAADLALALALISSAVGRPIAPDVVACGEVGLAGEVRNVGAVVRRLAEAERLGFRRALVPASAGGAAAAASLDAVPVATVAEAAVAAGVLPAGGSVQVPPAAGRRLRVGVAA